MHSLILDGAEVLEQFKQFDLTARYSSQRSGIYRRNSAS
jgi:hypothetical protein